PREILKEPRIGRLLVHRALEMARCGCPIFPRGRDAPQSVFAKTREPAFGDCSVLGLGIVECSYRNPSVAAKLAGCVRRAMKALELVEMRERGVEFSVVDQLADHREVEFALAIARQCRRCGIGRVWCGLHNRRLTATQRYEGEHGGQSNPMVHRGLSKVV